MDQMLHRSAGHIGSVSVPCIVSDIANIELMFQIWSDPRFIPGTSSQGDKPVLLIVFNTAGRSVISKTHRLYAAYPKLQEYFSKLVVVSARLRGARDLYDRESSEKMGKFGNKAGPNFLFQKTLNKAAEFGGFTLLIELDCFPFSAGWFTRSEKLVASGDGTWIIGSKYGGSFGMGKEILHHLNGNALYNVGSPKFIAFLNDIWITRVIELTDVAPYLAYDCWWAYEMDAADPMSGNDSWKLVQTYDSFFKNEPFIVNLLPAESTGSRILHMYNLFETLNKTPIFLHSPSIRPLVEETLAKRGTSLLEVLERNTRDHSPSNGPDTALPQLQYEAARTKANRKTGLMQILTALKQKLAR